MNRILLVGVIGILTAVGASADSFLMDWDETRADRNPDVAVDDSGGAVLVWESRVPGGAQPLTGLRVKRISPQGQVSEEHRIDPLPGFYARNPAVAVRPDGRRFVVVWEGGAEGDRSRRRIWARLFNGDGQPVGPEIRVEHARLHNENFGLPDESYGGPEVSMAPSGEFVVVWRSEGGTSCDRFNISARRFSARGEPAGPEFRVNEVEDWSQINPDIGHDDSGNFVVVWESGRWIGTTDQRSGIRGCRFDADGNRVGSELTIRSAIGEAASVPTLAVEGDGSFICGWKRWFDSGADVQLQAQCFSAGGEPMGERVDIQPMSSGLDHPKVTVVDESRFWLVWTDRNFDQPGGTHIRGQVFSKDGHAVGSPVTLSVVTCGDRRRPAVAAAPSGVMVGVWETFQPSGIEGRSISGDRAESSMDLSGTVVALDDLISQWRRDLLDPRTSEITRTQAAEHLGCQRGEGAGALVDLASCLKNDLQAPVRQACASALASVANPRKAAIPALLDAAENDNDSSVRRSAVRAIGALGSHGRPAAPRLIPMLHSSRIKNAAGLALGEMGAVDAADGIIAVLEKGRIRGRSAAGLFEGLGALVDSTGDPKADRALGSFCRDCRSDIREKKGRNKEPESFGSFVRRSAAMRGQGVAGHLDAFIKIGEDRLKNGLLGIVSDQADGYRASFEAVDRALATYLKDRDQFEISEFCPCLEGPLEGLRRIRSNRSRMSGLIEVTRGIPGCQRLILTAIETMGFEGRDLVDLVSPLTRHGSDVQLDAITTLRTIDPKGAATKEALIRCMADPKPNVVKAAMEGLVHIGPSGIRPVMDRFVVLSDSDDPEIRRAAEAGLNLIEIEAGTCEAETAPVLESVEPVPDPTAGQSDRRGGGSHPRTG